VLTPANAREAQEVRSNAIDSISSALSKVKGQSETIDAASTSLSSSIAVTKDAAASYLDTDLVEAASAFSAALKSILAAISTLQAGARVADAGLEIIKSAAQ
jgi:flagellin-like hook-associated protein FlgL